MKYDPRKPKNFDVIFLRISPKIVDTFLSARVIHIYHCFIFFSNLIFNNRLPYCYHFSAGGLVTAVAPVVIKGNGLWVGWAGIHLEEPIGEIPESDPNDKTPTAGLKSDQVSYTREPSNKINSRRV